MNTVKASEAKKNLNRVLDEASESHQPVLITGRRTNAVLVAEDDWRAIQETLYLLGIPGMRESVREGLETPIDECDKDVAW
jgi:prevent-host-death family protein